MGHYYFDHAAATAVDEQVLQAMLPFMSAAFYNPSATYGPARQVSAELESARARVAHWLGARPSEIIFTAGGTESDNLAIHGVMGTALRSDPSANLVVTAIEHDAVLRPADKYETRVVPVDGQAMVRTSELAAAIDGHTALVSVMYANNEVGTIQPLRDVAAAVSAERDRRRVSGNPLPIYLHTDACQAANYLDLHTARLGVDLMTLNGGKIYGPKQSGVLYVRGGLELQPLIHGGGQESGLRSGTENVAAAIGLATALDLVQAERQEEVRRLQALQRLFVNEVTARIPSAKVNGSLKKRLPNNVHLTLPGTDNERVLVKLEAAGVLAAAGSACSASNQEPSHVLRAIGLSDEEAQASLRFSMGRATDEAAVRAAVDALAGLA